MDEIEEQEIIKEWDEYRWKQKQEGELSVSDILDEIKMVQNNITKILEDDKTATDQLEMYAIIGSIKKDDDVYVWLNESVGLPQYYPMFLRNGFDDIRFMEDITLEDLIVMEIDKIGHQKRILRCVKEMTG